MATFVASEALLFGGLFALFLALSARTIPQAFHEAVRANTKTLGSINTGVLLASSMLLASAVHVARAGRNRRAAGLMAGTLILGVGFVAIKLTEYLLHFREGIYPGGAGHFFVTHPAYGMPEFWTLYYVMTGLHAIHVTVGAGVLAVSRSLRRRSRGPHSRRRRRPSALSSARSTGTSSTSSGSSSGRPTPA